MWLTKIAMVEHCYCGVILVRMPTLSVESRCRIEEVRRCTEGANTAGRSHGKSNLFADEQLKSKTEQLQIGSGQQNVQADQLKFLVNQLEIRVATNCFEMSSCEMDVQLNSLSLGHIYMVRGPG